MPLNPLTGIDTGASNPTGLRQAPPVGLPQVTVPTSQFTRGLRQGVAQVESAAQGTLAAGAGLVGADQFAQEQAQQAQDRLQTVARDNPLRVSKIEQIRTDSFDNLSADTGDFLAGLVGKQLPMLASLVVGAGVGGVALRAATGLSAATAGAAGVGGTSAGVEIGSIFPDIATDPGAKGSIQSKALTSIVGGTAAGAFDTLPAFQIASRLGLGRSLGREIRRGLLARTVKGGLETGATEAGTEAAQTVIERASRHFANNNFEVLGAQGVSDILNSAVAGGIIGAGLGSFSGAVSPVGSNQDNQGPDMGALHDLQAPEEAATALATKRIAELRGLVPNDQLDALQTQASAFPDKGVFDQIDALTPPEISQIRDSKGRAELQKLAEKSPLAAAELIINNFKTAADNPEVSISRREFSVLRNALGRISKRNPDAANTLIAELVKPDVVAKLEAQGVDLSQLDLSRLLDRPQQGSQQGSSLPESVADLEKSVINFDNIKARLSTEGKLYKTDTGLQVFPDHSRFVAKGFKGDRSAQGLVRSLEDQFPNRTYELVPARQLIESQLDDRFGPEQNFFQQSPLNKNSPRVDASASGFTSTPDAFAASATNVVPGATNAKFVDPERRDFTKELVRQEVERRTATVGVPDTFNAADPLSVFDNSFAIMERKVPGNIDATSRLALSAQDLDPGLDSFEKTIRGQSLGRATTKQEKADVNKRFKDLKLRRAILRDVPRGVETKNGRLLKGKLRNDSEFFVRETFSADEVQMGEETAFKHMQARGAKLDRVRIIFAPALTRRMLAKIRNERNEEFDALPTGLQVSRAFFAGMRSLRDAGFNMGTLETRGIVPEDTIIMKPPAGSDKGLYMSIQSARAFERAASNESLSQKTSAVDQFINTFSEADKVKNEGYFSTLKEQALKNEGDFTEFDLNQYILNTMDEVQPVGGDFNNPQAGNEFSDLHPNLQPGTGGLHPNFDALLFQDARDNAPIGKPVRLQPHENVKITAKERQLRKDVPLLNPNVLPNAGLQLEDEAASDRFMLRSIQLGIPTTDRKTRLGSEAANAELARMNKAVADTRTGTRPDPNAAKDAQLSEELGRIREAVQRHAAKDPTPESVRAAAFEALTAEEVRPFSPKEADKRLKAITHTAALARQVLSEVKDSEFKGFHTQLVREWNKLLGVNARSMNVSETVDVLLELNDYGRLRGILDGSLHGFSLPDGRIFVNPQLSSSVQLETLAHETGHAVFKQTVPADFDAVHEEWAAWRKRMDRPGNTVSNVNESKQRLRAAIDNAYNNTKLTLDSLNDTDRQYLLDFEEWFADQTALWLTQPNSKPANAVEGWFANFIRAIRALFTDLTEGPLTTSEQAAKFLNNRVVTLVRRSTTSEAHLDARIKDARTTDANNWFAPARARDGSLIITNELKPKLLEDIAALEAFNDGDLSQGALDPFSTLQDVVEKIINEGAVSPRQSNEGVHEYDYRAAMADPFLRTKFPKDYVPRCACTSRSKGRSRSNLSIRTEALIFKMESLPERRRIDKLSKTLKKKKSNLREGELRDRGLLHTRVSTVAVEAEYRSHTTSEEGIKLLKTWVNTTAVEGEVDSLAADIQDKLGISIDELRTMKKTIRELSSLAFAFIDGKRKHPDVDLDSLYDRSNADALAKEFLREVDAKKRRAAFASIKDSRVLGEGRFKRGIENNIIQKYGRSSEGVALLKKGLYLSIREPDIGKVELDPDGSKLSAELNASEGMNITAQEALKLFGDDIARNNAIYREVQDYIATKKAIRLKLGVDVLAVKAEIDAAIAETPEEHATIMDALGANTPMTPFGQSHSELRAKEDKKIREEAEAFFKANPGLYEAVSESIKRDVRNREAKKRRASFAVVDGNVKDSRSISKEEADQIKDIAESFIVETETETLYVDMAREYPFSDINTWVISDFFTHALSSQEKRILGNAFTQGTVRKQMNRILKNEVGIRDAIQGSIIDTITFGYVLWKAGMIDIGPQTQGVFGKAVDYLSNSLGFVPAHEQATDLLDQIQNQKYDINRFISQGSAYNVQTVVRDTLLKNFAQGANDLYNKWAKPWMDRAFLASLGRMLDTNNPALRQLGILGHTPPNEQGISQGYLANKEVQRVQFTDDISRATNNERDPEKLKVLWRALMLNEDPGTPQLRHSVSEIRKRLDDMYLYAKRSGLPMRNRKNYFPWVYDREYLQNHKDEFVALLQRPAYRKRIMAIMKGYSDHFERYKSKIEEHEKNPDNPAPAFSKYENISAEIVFRFGKIDPAGISEIIYENIVDTDGYGDAELDFSRASHTPFVRALNTRSLGFMLTDGTEQDKNDFLKFFNGNFDYTIRTYIDQVVKRAEFTKTFNAKTDPFTKHTTSSIDTLLAEAVQFGASKADIATAHDYVNSLQGTHGARTSQWLGKIPLIGDKIGSGEDNKLRVINPRLQMVQSWIIVWQNLRVLSMATLTSLSDPIGIAVRGGGADTVMASIKALKKDSRAREVAAKLGIISDYTINEMLGALYSNNFMSAAAQATNEKFFKYTGLSALTRATRVMATGAALEFMRTHAMSDSELSTRFLDDLNLEATDVILDEQSNVKIRNRPEMDALWSEFEKTGDGTILAEIEREERVRKAINRFVDEAILRPNAATRTIWASDPHFVLMAHLKSFIYTFHNQILKRVYNEAALGNYTPVAMLMVYVPFMIAADLLRDIVRFGPEGNPRKNNWSLVDYTKEGIQRAGLPGVSTFLADAKQDRQFGGFGFESFLGPTYQSITQLDNIFLGTGSGSYQAILDQLPLQNTPVVEGLR